MNDNNTRENQKQVFSLSPLQKHLPTASSPITGNDSNQPSPHLDNYNHAASPESSSYTSRSKSRSPSPLHMRMKSRNGQRFIDTEDRSDQTHILEKNSDNELCIIENSDNESQELEKESEERRVEEKIDQTQINFCEALERVRMLKQQLHEAEKQLSIIKRKLIPKLLAQESKIFDLNKLNEDEMIRAGGGGELELVSRVDENTHPGPPIHLNYNHFKAAVHYGLINMEGEMNPDDKIQKWIDVYKETHFPPKGTPRLITTLKRRYTKSRSSSSSLLKGRRRLATIDENTKKPEKNEHDNENGNEKENDNKNAKRIRYTYNPQIDPNKIYEEINGGNNPFQFKITAPRGANFLP